MTEAFALSWHPPFQQAAAREVPLALADGNALPSVGADDDRLVDAYRRSGDASAFAALVRRHQDRVFRLALAVLGPGAEIEAEDVTQEVFLRVHRQLSTFRGDASFRSWLHRVTFNLAVDRRRLARWRLPHVDPGPLDSRPADARADDPYERAAAAERAEAIRRAIDALPDVERTIVRLHYWMDLPVERIGDLLRMRPGTVKSHLFRGRQRLFFVLEGRGIGHD